MTDLFIFIYLYCLYNKQVDMAHSNKIYSGGFNGEKRGTFPGDSNWIKFYDFAQN